MENSGFKRLFHRSQQILDNGRVCKLVSVKNVKEFTENLVEMEKEYSDFEKNPKREFRIFTRKKL